MKAKDLKILRKKLTKANRSENNPLDSFSKDALAFKVLRHPEKDAAVEKAAEKVLSVKFLSSSGLSEIEFQEVLFLFERNMGELYKSSSWGLNMDEKALELKHDKARFLLLKTEDDKLAGFLCFRFVYDDDEYPTQAVVYVYECVRTSHFILSQFLLDCSCLLSF